MISLYSVSSLLATSTPELLAEVSSQISHLTTLFQLPYLQDQLPTIIRVIRKRIEEYAVEKVRKQNEEGQQQKGKGGKQQQQKGKSSEHKSQPSTNSTHSSSPSSSQPPLTPARVSEILSTIDLGHPTTGDNMVDQASQVLRLLFLHDLRATQNLSNELMILCQEYTANPKTDAKLGKVGI